ncbi:hypothetical protein NUW58_g9230 [Xylaria curta]|uniref:Uncharacterized protein n=1 Tax=Xylaria curta TaxID=42375 RepID=A0ACC1N0T4_9PEZI|nr:hypothetical protein NUW58_g9230 [Xylaria curta]
MGPFALSVPSYRLGVHPHKRRHGDAARRDAEARSPSPHTDSDAETQFSSTSRLPSETINPLSHSPDTLRQLAVAGLAPEDELPSRAHPGFPHKPLPSSSSSRRRRGGRRAALSSDGGGSGVETDSTIASQRSRRIDNVDGKQHSARMRHLNTMTAIMHRCLRDGDIARAKRALGLLVRTRDVDLRVDNLWAIGSEILMRDGEVEVIAEQKKPSSALPSSLLASSSYGNAQAGPDALSGSYIDEEPDIAETREGQGDGEDGASAKESPRPPHRWGSAANVSRVKQYFETLIQHHPYDGHRPQLTSAVDFWPALFGIEVYNLDAEMQSALHHIHTEHGFPSSSRSPSPARE